MKQARKLLPLAIVAAALISAPAASAAEQTFVGQVPTGTIGPYEVKQDIKFPVPTPPAGVYITKMETDIVDATTGDPVPISRLMLHHIVFANVGQPDSTCNGQGFLGFDSRPDPYAGVPVQRFYAAGEERAKLALPDGYGYENTGLFWGMTYMVMNHRNVPDNALIKYTVTYEDDPVGEGLTAVTPWWLDVRDCRADPIYNVPGAKKKAKKGKKGKGKKPSPAPIHTESRDYTIPAAGRIVAGAGHVHGGAHRLTVTQPDCGNRQVADSNPTWGLADHPFYTVRPVLHEPGPINMSAFQSDDGVPVAAGSKLRLNSIYDNSKPHTRVMGIFLVFLAPPNPGPPPQSCDALPGDVQTFATDQPGRSGPISYKIPLTGLDQAGNAVTISKPPGKLKRAKSGATIQVMDRYFGKQNVLLKQGGSLNYQFSGGELHNLTLANGPLGIGSDNLNGSRTFSQKFKRAGTYNFFCGLHPVQMSQRVIVKGKKKRK